MTEPDFIVVRPAPDLPPGFLPAVLDGRWYDRRSVPQMFGEHSANDGVAVATGRFEVRDDGAVAEIYEVRP